MKLKHATDNGNVDKARRYINSNIVRNTENRNWSSDLNSRNKLGFDTSSSISDDLSNYNSQNVTEVINESADTQYDANVQPELVCNHQYRLDTKYVTKFENLRNKTQFANLEGATESFLTSCESFLESNDSQLSTPNDEERAFGHSDSEEASDKGALPAPRGIVNPNYPGFQHLAHTLQNYSSDIENYYHSENDMTDDDIDIEITDATYDVETKIHNMTTDYSNINNNNNYDSTEIILNCKKNVQFTFIEDDSYSEVQSNIPDLLKTITHNNNTDTISYDCSATDIENNFNTKDIIGDFNKEIEDEIKQVLNYNINIQDDLQELKKDIEDNLTKPIENTINNISDVVNHVIKKLVETQCDINESESNDSEKLVSDTEYLLNKEIIESENEKNTLKEMNLSRPSFLIVENNINKSIADAFLSNGKDEIKVYEQDYNTDKISINVENTIKQLSSELRKIIPKLDELRDREKLFAGNKNETHSMITDGNCNEIASSSTTFKTYSDKSPKEGVRSNSKENNIFLSVKKNGFRRNNPKISLDRQSDFASSSSSHNPHYLSVQNKEECDLGSFDVYNIETALPKLDIDTIESYLKAAKEAERRKRNDREEIRRRLAMGAESEDFYSLGHVDRPGKKPSLQSRLQSGKNLQICFMNETASDNESQTSDVERNISHSNRNLSKSSIFSKSNYSLNNHPYQTRPLSVNITKHDKISTVQSAAKLRPSSLSVKATKSKSAQSLGQIELKESDFFALQATLQTEARMALAQAKEMARIQMERERRGRAASPVEAMLRRSMEKAHAPLAAGRRRVSRHLLTDMNIAQLQVIVNELHSQIESLNESLVKLLMARDELHMGQDSMLVDIEDLTRYLGVKEQSKKSKAGSKSAVRRLTSFVHK